MRKKPNYLPPGPISTGTLRPEDVTPALLDATETVRMSRADRKAVNALRREWNTRQEELEYDDSTWIGELWSDLLDALQAYAPPGHYVGAHPGDDADIGCWPSEDVPAFDRDTPPTDREAPDGVAFKVSDHGDILGVWSATYGDAGTATRWHYQPL